MAIGDAGREARRGRSGRTVERDPSGGDAVVGVDARRAVRQRVVLGPDRTFEREVRQFDPQGVLAEGCGTDVDGGPNAGERVVGIRRGQAWAERVSAPRNWVAALPDGITFTQAAALPTAGLTALRTLRFGPAILGRRVLVTGASGGVGRFAIQLAHLGGADVTALVSRPERAAGLAELGADRVVADPDHLSGRFDLILESVGGRTLARLLTRLDPEGTLITFGNSSDETTTFNVSDVYPDALVRIRGFEVFYAPDPFARDLRFLADLVADGKLDPQLADEMPWEAMPKALQRLENRDVAGKVALTINV